MKYDVFISFKNSGKDGSATPDAATARRVYNELKGIGLKVFFSEESLAEAGQGHFSKSIETALESSRILVLVASCREHIESRWVEAEWDSFLQDVRSGNKQGEMFILSCGDLNPSDLPLFLRRQQMFAADSLDKLIKFIGNAIPSRNSLRDFIQLSLHCFRPDKNEDKVYLVTVHPGTSADSFHVTAYWGARTAKRLSSQLKAINVSAEKAQMEVEKAKQEKVRSGYLPAPHAKILSDEARSHLSAALGLDEVAEQTLKKVATKLKTKRLDDAANIPSLPKAKPKSKTATSAKPPPARKAAAKLKAKTPSPSPLKSKARPNAKSTGSAPTAPKPKAKPRSTSSSSLPSKPKAAVKTSKVPALKKSTAKAKVSLRRA